MQTQTYKIKGMHCASCASIIEKTLKKVDGVTLAEVNYGIETVKVIFDNSKTTPQDLSKKIEPLGYSFVFQENNSHVHDEHADPSNTSKNEKLKELKDM